MGSSEFFKFKDGSDLQGFQTRIKGLWLQEKEMVLHSSSNPTSSRRDRIDMKIKGYVCDIQSTRRALLDHSFPSNTFTLHGAIEDSNPTFTGGVSKASALLKRLQTLNKKLEDSMQKRRLISPLEESQVFDRSSAFWTTSRAEQTNVVDAYCNWQTNLQERRMLLKDLKICYKHFHEDHEVLMLFIRHETRVFPRKQAHQTLSILAYKMELIKNFCLIHNIHI